MNIQLEKLKGRVSGWGWYDLEAELQGALSDYNFQVDRSYEARNCLLAVQIISEEMVKRIK